MALNVRIDEGEQEQPTLFWDSRWTPWRGQADWAIADATETQNRGGLSARAALHTAVVIALFTDKRISKEHPLFHLVEDGDQRGWFGDGVDVRADLYEDEMGSLLWIFERAYLNEEIRRWVEIIALEALQPLIAQGAAVRIEAQAEAHFAINRVDLAVQIYARDGSRLYDYKFDNIWAQTSSAPKPEPFPTVPPKG
jgi:phage gp46-like protein